MDVMVMPRSLSRSMESIRRSATIWLSRNVPLWRSRSSYDAAGLDLLVQRSRDWYARRGQQRRIKPGDRLAVLGHGIAVVERVDGKEVHAVLWNRDMVRVGRKEIVWDEGNNRWETTIGAAMSNRTLKEY